MGQRLGIIGGDIVDNINYIIGNYNQYYHSKDSIRWYITCFHVRAVLNTTLHMCKAQPTSSNGGKVYNYLGT